MTSFNRELIERVIKYFKEKKGVVISIETAEEYLNSMADLYASFIEFLQPNEKEK
jgi:hypothetical protein